MRFLKHTTIKTNLGSLLLVSVLSLCIVLIAAEVDKTQNTASHTTAFAQSATCTQPFQPVATPLTDLGTNEYMKRTSSNPPTYTPTGLIGGLYDNGSNSRPAAHDAAGIALAADIQPLNSAGNPDPNGKIGFVSIGMSNTNSEFARFMSVANADPDKNPQVILVNGAAGGGTADRWLHPTYGTTYWNNLTNQVANRGLTDNQVQVVWLKITTLTNGSFPTNIELFQAELEELSRRLKTRFPNLKITYLSSRIRSYYVAGAATAEPAAYENAFAFRNMLLKQINGDPTMNFDPSEGPVSVSYMAWGPYLWVDGENMRSDGRTWPANYLASDCVHPSSAGNQAVTDMLMSFFKSDTTATPWFLSPGTSVSPTPTPLPNAPTYTPTPTIPATATPTRTPTPLPSATATPTSTAPTNTPPAGGGTLTHWSFDTNSVTPDSGTCSNCANYGATWTSAGRVNGAFHFDGTNDRINLGSFPYLNNASSFSLALWVKPSFNQTEPISRYMLSSSSGIQFFYLSNLNDWRFTIRTSTGSIQIDTQNLTWATSTWHHMAVTYDGSQLRLYWDGSLVSTRPASGTVYPFSGSTYLGSAVINSNYFPGAIDELHVYSNRVLSSQEIQELVQ